MNILPEASPPPTRNLLEIIPALVFYIDASGIVRRMSLACEDWSGIPREDWLHRPYDEVLPRLLGETSAADAQPSLRRALGGVAERFEGCASNSRGLRTVEVTCTPDRGESGALCGVLILINDTTELRDAQEHSRATDERLRLATEAGSMGFWEHDIQTGKLAWSSTCFEIFGFTGRTHAPSWEELFSRIHPEDRRAQAAALRAARRNRTTYHCEYRVQTRDGDYRWVHSRGYFVYDAHRLPTRILGVAFDISKRRTAEEYAAGQTERIGQLLESTTDGVFMVDREWRLSYMNSRGAAILGLDSDPLGLSLWDIFPQTRGSRFAHYYRRTMLDRTRSSFEEYYPEPLHRWFEVHTHPTDEGFAGFFRDTTDRRLAEQALRLQKQAIAAVPVGITIALSDPAAGYPLVYANPAFEAISGYQQEELLGRSSSLLHGPDDGPGAGNLMRQAIEDGAPARAVLRNYRKDGTSFINELSISPVRGETGEVTHLVGIQVDVTERVASAERLSRQARYDAVTGIPNRHYFLELLKQTLRSVNRDGEGEAALIYLDLDNLKHVNDTLGHHGGDRVLRQIAQRIRSAIRKSDMVARIGGDEFVLLVTGDDARMAAEKLVERVLRKVTVPCRFGGRELIVTASAGYAIAPCDATEPRDLLRKADLAMYSAKRESRNSWKCWDPSMEAGADQILDIAAGLRHALRRDELFLAYQPRIDAASGSLHSMEALIRWQHPEQGVIYPGDFIPVAEETGLILEIGAWVLRESVRQLAEWHSRGLPIVPVSVNVSAAQFRNPAFPTLVREALDEAGIAPHLLEVELTESVFMDESFSGDLLDALRAAGVRIAIDDFGTGYSGLGYLGRFAVDILKIDRTFISTIGENQRSASICRSILQLAQELELTTVAEGVETAEQADLLRAWGCDQLQGYHFGRPMPASAIAAGFLTRRSLSWPSR